MLMPFGKYRGWELEELPDSYLEWLISSVSLREPLLSAVHREISFRSWGRHEETAIVSQNLDRIKAIYWDLARQYHPDRIGGNGDVMKGINIFYERLQTL